MQAYILPIFPPLSDVDLSARGQLHSMTSLGKRESNPSGTVDSAIRRLAYLSITW